MEKIAEKHSQLGTYIFYKGFDKEIILKHIENHNNETLMIVMATATEFLENLPDERIKCDYLAMYEVYSNHEEWVEKWWGQTRPVEFYPEWLAGRGILDMDKNLEEMHLRTIDKDGSLEFKKKFDEFMEKHKEESQKIVDMMNYEDGAYDEWVVYPMKNLKHYEMIMDAEEESWNVTKIIIQDLRAIGKTEDEILKEIHWKAFNDGCRFNK